MAGRTATAGHQHESPNGSRERARRAAPSAPDRAGDAAQPHEARVPGSSLLDLSNAATQLSQDEEVRSGAPAPAPPPAPDSLGFSVPELLPSQPDSQPLQLPSQADIPIPVLAAAHLVPPAAPTLIGSPASPGYASLPLQAVPRAPAGQGQGPSALYAQAQAVKQLQGAQRQGHELGAADFDGSPGVAGAMHAQAGPMLGAPRQRRPTRRGPMDEMRQLVRILVKVCTSICPATVRLVHGCASQPTDCTLKTLCGDSLPARRTGYSPQRWPGDHR